MMRRGLIGESFARVGRGRRPRGVIQRFRLGTEQLERRRALAVITPFTIRYQTNDTGDITFAANTLMTAPSDDPAAVDAQNGVGGKVANNDFLMTYVDVDTDPNTFNSSRSDLVMPAGSQVLFAGLYWGARTNGTAVNASTALRDTVKFMTPGGAVYQELTGSPISKKSNDYQRFKDVTSIVAGAGAGTYTVANVQAQKDKTDTYAGWSLVVVYRAPGEPARNLTVFDGYASVSKTPSSNATVNIPISGFKAPTTGPVKATLGFIAYEGDLAKTGDTVKFDGKSLSDAANPVNDFFNSTISNRGTLISTKDPNYVNQLGYDADLITADGIIKNGATSATITMTTGGETYYPGVVTSAIEIFAPEIAVVKSVMDENGGDVVGGDDAGVDIRREVRGREPCDVIHWPPSPTPTRLGVRSRAANRSRTARRGGAAPCRRERARNEWRRWCRRESHPSRGTEGPEGRVQRCGCRQAGPWETHA
jgi:hypothetical protein